MGLNMMTAVVVKNITRAQDHEEEQQKLTIDEVMFSVMKELYLELRELNGGSDTIRRVDFAQWIEEDEIVVRCMRRLKWSRHYMTSCFALCDHDHTQKASLESLLGIWEGIGQQLTCETYARFQEHLNGRLESIDHLNTIIMTN